MIEISAEAIFIFVLYEKNIGVLQYRKDLYYKKTVDGIKQYNSYDDPWEKTSSFIYIDEDKKQLIVYNLIGSYVFQEE